LASKWAALGCAPARDRGSPPPWPPLPPPRDGRAV
jgi:hypothetical protein